MGCIRQRSSSVIVGSVCALGFFLPPDGVSADASTTIKIVLGQPEMQVYLDDQAVGRTDRDGVLTLEVQAADKQQFRIRAQGADHVLGEVSRNVFRQGIRVTWNLSWKVEEIPRPRVEPRDPCAGLTPRGCQHLKWRSVQQLVQEGRCERGMAQLEDFLQREDTTLTSVDFVQEVAGAYLTCGRRAGRRDWVEESIEYLETFGGDAVLCAARRSQQLAAAYDYLDDPRRAAGLFGAARSTCENDSALEWQFYFLMAGKEFDKAEALLLEQAPTPLQRFLRAWLQVATGECPTAAALDASVTVPCSALSEAYCHEQLGLFNHLCGNTTAHHRTAADHFQAAYKGLDRDGRNFETRELGILENWANSAYLAQDFRSSKDLFRQLVERQVDKRAELYRRYADSLLFAGQGQDELEAAKAAYLEASEVYPSNPTIRAILLNNLGSLAARLYKSERAPRTVLEDAAETLEQAAAVQLDGKDSIVAASIKFNLAQVEKELTESDTTLSHRARYRRMKELSKVYREYERKMPVFVGEEKPRYVEHDGSFFAIVIFDGQ